MLKPLSQCSTLSPENWLSKVIYVFPVFIWFIQICDNCHFWRKQWGGGEVFFSRAFSHLYSGNRDWHRRYTWLWVSNLNKMAIISCKLDYICNELQSRKWRWYLWEIFFWLGLKWVNSFLVWTHAFNTDLREENIHLQSWSWGRNTHC